MSIKTRRWIMVADNDEAFRKSTTDLLISHFGKEVKIVAAEDGSAAYAKIKNQTFHLIISEWNLPRKSGDELIEATRNNPFNEHTPLIITSAEEIEDVEKNFEFVNFVKKPIDPFEFAQIVRNLFNLGSTEKMISASIFSSLLDSSTAFLEEALKRKDFKVGEMKLKKRGEELTGDHAAIITVFVGKVSNTFSVLCSKETLEKLRDKSEKISGSTLDVICKSLGYVILKHVLTECGIINHNEVHTKDITQDPALLTEKQGIVVPISANGIDYKIFATTKGGDI
jgi:CheY-like chemotaxis protein